MQDGMEKILISALSAILGFALSQTFNFVNFVRRPKFRVKHWGDGILSSYTGDPPETPWEIELGFYLENQGRNSAKNTRIFVSDIKTSFADGDLEETSIELLEIRRPIDLIPPKECIRVKLGTIRSSNCELELNLESPLDDTDSDAISADTRGKIRFSAKFHVSCDDNNSFSTFVLDFSPDKDDWASSLLEDYTQDRIKNLARPSF